MFGRFHSSSSRVHDGLSIEAAPGRITALSTDYEPRPVEQPARRVRARELERGTGAGDRGFDPVGQCGRTADGERAVRGVNRGDGSGEPVGELQDLACRQADEPGAVHCDGGAEWERAADEANW